MGCDADFCKGGLEVVQPTRKWLLISSSPAIREPGGETGRDPHALGIWKGTHSMQTTLDAPVADRITDDIRRPATAPQHRKPALGAPPTPTARVHVLHEIFEVQADARPDLVAVE